LGVDPGRVKLEDEANDSECLWQNSTASAKVSHDWFVVCGARSNAALDDLSRFPRSCGRYVITRTK